MARLADLRSRPVLRVASELGIPVAHAQGLRELLYGTAFQHADPTVGDALDVELSAGWDGERGRFVAAAVAAGMLVKAEGEVFVLPDFEDAAPDWAKKRAERANERKAAGKTIWDVRSEAGKKGAAARASNRQASGRRLPPARQQMATLPPSVPSSVPTDIPEELRSSSAATVGAPPKSRKAPENGPLGAYYTAWHDRYGESPSPTKPDVLAATKALEPFPPAEREALARAFVLDDDTWLCEKGHRLGLLPGQLDRIRLKRSGKLRGNQGMGGYKGMPSLKIVPSGTDGGHPATEETAEEAAPEEPEGQTANASPSPAVPAGFAQLKELFPWGGSSEAAARTWESLGLEDRKLALVAARHLSDLWPHLTVIERGRVQPLAVFLRQRLYRDLEDLDVELLGNRRYVVVNAMRQAAEMASAPSALEATG